MSIVNVQFVAAVAQSREKNEEIERLKLVKIFNFKKVSVPSKCRSAGPLPVACCGSALEMLLVSPPPGLGWAGLGWAGLGWQTGYCSKYNSC